MFWKNRSNGVFLWMSWPLIQTLARAQKLQRPIKNTRMMTFIGFHPTIDSDLIDPNKS